MAVDFKRCKEVFLAALEQPTPETRDRCLGEMCRADQELRRRVDELLRRHEQAGSFLEPLKPAVTQTLTPTSSLVEPMGSGGSHVPAVAETISQAETTERGDLVGKNIGPYQLLAQLGEGGMGVVYKACHRELGRVVALKMIKAGAHAEQKDLARFLAEAGAVAKLHHPNIVQLYDFGTHEGLPYFTLELMADGALAGKLRDGPLAPREAAGLIELLARGMHHAHQAGIIHRDLKPANILLQIEDCGSKIEESGKSTISNLQSAIPKIADFGLVKRVEAGDEQTVSGAIMGTPQYMAPEQAKGDSKRVGPAADVYALGAILYECLTGRPPFRGPTLWETVQQVLRSEPVPPRRLQPNVPKDLETVCLKCLHKETDRRYTSAEALAEDLRRFRVGEPIQARPVGWVERAAKFAKRHRAAAALSVAVALFAVAAISASIWVLHERVVRAEAEANQVKLEAKLHLEETRRAEQKKPLEKSLAEALAGLNQQRQQLHELLSKPLTSARLMSDLAGWEKRVTQLRDSWEKANLLVTANQDVLADTSWSAELESWNKQIGADERDWQVAKELADIQLEATSLFGRNVQPELVVKKYVVPFGKLKLDLQHGNVDKLAAIVTAAPLRYVLVAALDHWAITSIDDSEMQRRLMAMARKADPDPWKDQLRTVTVAENLPKLQEIAAKMNLDHESPQTILLLFWVLKQASGKHHLPVLRQALLYHPGDFSLNFELGFWTKDPVEKVACLRAALAQRPNDLAANTCLGTILTDQGDLAAAIICHKKAVAADKNSAFAHHNMGVTLYAKKDLTGAIVCYEEAIRLDPNYDLAYYNLGNTLRDRNDTAGAIKAYRKAIAANPKLALAHVNLGVLLYDPKNLTKAIACFNDAIAADPKHAPAYHNLGMALKDRNDLPGAIIKFQEAITLDPKLIGAHFHLGLAWKEQMNLTGAIACFQKVVELDQKHSAAHFNLGLALYLRPDVAGAVAAFQKVTELDPKFAPAHFNLGLALKDQNDLTGAIASFQKAVDLDPKLAMAHYNLGVALAARKDLIGAIAAYKKAVAADPKYAAAYNNLGVALSAQNDLDGAIAAYKKAVAADPNLAAAHSGLGTALYAKKDLAGAVASFRKAVALDQTLAVAHGALGRALLDQGNFEEAKLATLEALKRIPPGHPLASLGQKQLLKCEELLALDRKLAAIVQDQAQAGDPMEQLALANLCRQYKKQYAAAAKFYTAALTAQPGLAEQHRYHAACAAALAAADKGKDSTKPTVEQKTKLRQQALAWLKADLMIWQRQATGELAAREAVVKALAHWQTDPDLASVREVEELTKLAEAERKNWQQLWTEVDKLLKQAKK
jgi:serine/threonine protein kinase/Flp pilus assembly protein TadD